MCVSVTVADIKAVITGKDCPHVKEKGSLKQNKVSFHNEKAIQIINDATRER